MNAIKTVKDYDCHANIFIMLMGVWCGGGGGAVGSLSEDMGVATAGERGGGGTTLLLETFDFPVFL